MEFINKFNILNSMSRTQMTNKMRLGILSIACSILMFTTQISLVSGSVVWNYTFDTSLPPDWEVSNGAVAVVDGVLNATECDKLGGIFSPGSCQANLWLESNATSGVWHLDYFRASDAPFSWLWVGIMGQGVSAVDAGDLTNGWPNKYYCLFIPEDQVILGYDESYDCTQGKVEVDYTLEIGWHSIEITRNSTGEMDVTIDNSLVLSNTLTQLSVSEYFTIELSLGDMLDNVSYSDETQSVPPPDDSSTNSKALVNGLYITTFSAIAVIGIIGSSKYYTKKKRSANYKHKLKSKLIINQVGQDFELTNLSLFALIASNKTYQGRSKNVEIDLEDVVPQKLLKYRYLMHPIRLTTMRSLFDHDTLKSAEVRALLGITWGEFRTHLKSLEDHDYLEINDGFDENGYVVQTLQITHLGRIEYKQLYDLLSQFMDRKSPINGILNDDDPFLNENEFYPST